MDSYVFSHDLEEISRKCVLITGFAGFGNVGYNVITHLMETIPDLKSVGVWGDVTWFHKQRLESLFPLLYSPSLNICLLTSRVPIPPSKISKKTWGSLLDPILSLPFERIIVLGGVRESFRKANDNSWFFYIPSERASTFYNCENTFNDDLLIIGPLSWMLTNGILLDKNILGILAYCNSDDDTDASAYILDELQKVLTFDFSPIPLQKYSIHENSASFLHNSVADDSTELTLKQFLETISTISSYTEYDEEEDSDDEYSSDHSYR